MALRIHAEVLVLVRRMRPVLEAIGKHDRDLERQARKPVSSVALNGREGDKQSRGRGRSRFEDAMGSANEVKACLEVADALGYIEEQRELVDAFDRVARVLNKLRR